jgi:hypothetical protein
MKADPVALHEQVTICVPRGRALTLPEPDLSCVN